MPVQRTAMLLLLLPVVAGRAPPFLEEALLVRVQRRQQAPAAAGGPWNEAWQAPAGCLPMRSYTTAETTAWLSSMVRPA
jgi:hypothetical protein